jgi:phage shock protein C
MTDAPYRRLLRPLDDRVVAGVCSGIGRYFGVDPVLIRVAFVIFAAVTWGAALIAYPVMWFLIPEAPAAAAAPAPTWGRPPGS